MRAPVPPPPRQSTRLRIVYHGGIRDGETADLEDQTTHEVTFGIHRNPNFAVLDRYLRTEHTDPATGRIIFGYAGYERAHFSTCGIAAALHHILLGVGLRQPRVVSDTGA